MNILIPHTWLQEHLDTEAKPETIAKLMSLSGPSVEAIYDKESDQVYDIEVTTNRVDSMSIRGIAREAAVILKTADLAAELKPHQLKPITDLKPEGKILPLPEITSDSNLNQRTLCVVLDSIKRNPTPDWMAQRLLHTDMNVHDAAIDITNYITHELGHPCHAFDYHKLMKTGGVINIVEADAGESFTTLDGNTYETVGGEVVFKNGEGVIIDLPSIKGTANTSVDENTTAILLLMESIKADKVRFASMTHAIRTTAAQLMEKHVDPNLADLVMARGVKLYQDLCEAVIASEVYDDFPANTETKEVTIKLSTIKRYLGVELDLETITTILEMLECSVVISDEAKTLTVTPPTFRPDITIPADIVEEIARIYGYHRLPSKLMETAIPTNKPATTDYQLENKIKHFLANQGWQEVYTYSMVSQAIAQQSGYPLDEHLAISNPLTEDREVLRRSLLPSLIEVLNANPERNDLTVFEIANVYESQQDSIPKHTLQLGIATKTSYRTMKGIVESLLAQFHLPKVTWQNDQATVTGWVQSASIVVETTNETHTTIGTIGLATNNNPAAVIDIASLINIATTHPTYQPLAKAAPIKEDLTFTIDTTVAIGDLITKWQTASDLLVKVELISIYEQNHAFRLTYQHPEDNISAESITPIRKNIVTIADKLGAKLVGSVD